MKQKNNKWQYRTRQQQYVNLLCVIYIKTAVSVNINESNTCYDVNHSIIKNITLK